MLKGSGDVQVDQEPAVILVDDNAGMRKSLGYVLANVDAMVVSFSTPGELLAVYDADRPGCLVLDLRLPAMSGLELWRKLRDRGGSHPCIIMSGHGTIPEAVEAIQSGAINFLEKPLDQEQFITCVRGALNQDAEQREVHARRKQLQQSLSLLTPRERQVLDLVLDGKLSKQIARELDITTKTVEVHRSNVIKKMGVGSVAQLFKQMSQHLYGLVELTSNQARRVEPTVD